KKKGFFETADGGTILIDELQNLSPYIQSKLLMVAEEKTITPLGSTSPVKIDVRIIGATNKDIIASVKEEKSFREDLFYRLGEFMIYLPPLRERLEDIPFLAEKFIREAAEDLNKEVHTISEDVLNHLKNYSWPGNIRELRNFIERMMILFNGGEIDVSNLPLEMKPQAPSRATDLFSLPADGVDLESLEIGLMNQALDASKGNKSRAARLLGLTRDTFLYRLKKYAL
ncbi:MAG: sigma-54-dependent Fis family transcriptional regulator, partial [Gammaproteobacteria bacterium]|nr:sigma-54-dependent Fis family transcriptional regulator [Gammaproteobacteria bacterium]